MKAAGMIVAFVAVALAGCSAGSGLTTGALLGEDKPAAPVNDGPSRAFQVGTASARAVKCGFNFDPAKLKTNYIAYEKQQPGGQDVSKVERIYDVSFNGVAKAVAAEGDYCSRWQNATDQGRPHAPPRRRLHAEPAEARGRRRPLLGLGPRRQRQRGNENQASHGQLRLMRGRRRDAVGDGERPGSIV